MEKQFSAVGQGMMKVFFGVCLSVAYVLLNTTGLVLGLMPLRVLSAIMCLAVFFMVFVGLTASSIAESGYCRAIWCARGSAVAGLLAALIVDNEILIFTLAVLRQLLEIAGIVIVCRLSSRLMAERDGGRDTGRGNWTWRLCTLCGCGGIFLCRCCFLCPQHEGDDGCGVGLPDATVAEPSDFYGISLPEQGCVEGAVKKRSAPAADAPGAFQDRGRARPWIKPSSWLDRTSPPMTVFL